MKHFITYAALQPYRLKDLAELYGLERHTMLKWLKAIAADTGERVGRYYTTRQVEVIFREYGRPEKVREALGVRH